MSAARITCSKHTYAVLDGWRGICAVLVAMYHCRTGGYLDSLPLVRNAYLFVDFFFVLSGFVVSHAYLDRLETRAQIATMIWRRFARLWPLHVTMLALFIALELASGAISALTGMARSGRLFDPGSGNLLEAIPTHVLMLHSLGLHDRLTWNVPSWSISAEFFTYTVFAVAVIATRGRTALLALLLAAFGAAVVMIYADALMAAHHDVGFFRCMYGFFIGHLIYLMKDTALLPPAGGRALASGMEFVAIAAVLAFVACLGSSPASYAAPLVMGAAVLVFSRGQGRISDWFLSPALSRLGRWSYSVYMVHALILAILHRVLSVAGKLTAASYVETVATPEGLAEVISLGSPLVMDLLMLGYVGATVALAALTWRLIEMPAQRWLNRMQPPQTLPAHPPLTAHP